MAVPEFQAFIRPVLSEAQRTPDLHVRQFMEKVREHFDLSEQELSEMLPSGTQSRFENRVSWAINYLYRAGMLDRTGRGVYRITKRGDDALVSGPKIITRSWLSPFLDEYVAKSFLASEGNQVLDEKVTPEETMEAGYQSLRQLLANELIRQIKSRSPEFFERLVVDLLVAMGYGGSITDAGQAIGRTSDGGIDGIIKEDKLGLDFIFIQAKRWETVVGRPIVQGFAGSLHGFNAQKGVMITTSTFSKEARDYATQIAMRIVLIDGQELAQLMIDHGVGVATVTTYAVKRVDAEYFEG